MAATTDVITSETAQLEIEDKTTATTTITDGTSKEEIKVETSSDAADLISNAVDSKSKKRLDKLLDGFFKRQSNATAKLTVDEKYYLIAQKYFDQQEQIKNLQANTKELEKTLSLTSKQRDQIQTEYTKSLLAKTQLESLCRELQKVNKQIKDENLQRIKDEEDRRKEITGKFQVSIDEINQQVNANAEKNQNLIKENAQLAERLKSLVDQYELREQHVEKILKHKDLEVQLADAKFQQSELKFNDLTERNKKEKEIYEAHLGELIKKCKIHEETEKQLKGQLAVYTEKYDEFQQTLSKSNSIFDSFKTEMDKMSKKMKKVEQDANAWKLKYENSLKSLSNAAGIKESLEKEIKKHQNKADVMEQLCRKLQIERTGLLQELKTFRGEEHQQVEKQTEQEASQQETAVQPEEALQTELQSTESKPANLETETNEEAATTSSADVTSTTNTTETPSNDTVEIKNE